MIGQFSPIQQAPGWITKISFRTSFKFSAIQSASFVIHSCFIHFKKWNNPLPLSNFFVSTIWLPSYYYQMEISHLKWIHYELNSINSLGPLSTSPGLDIMHIDNKHSINILKLHDRIINEIEFFYVNTVFCTKPKQNQNAFHS